MSAKNVKVKYFTDAIEPLRQVDGSDWIDLRVAEYIEMEAGEVRLLPLGVAIQLPMGYEAIVAPRSSTYTKWSIIPANSIGVIDESYCGDGDEWRFPAIALMDTKIPCNTRICQFRIQKKQPKLNFMTVDHLENPDRGGIGSTGER